MSDLKEKISQLREIAGVSTDEVARTYLEVYGGNLESAINAAFEDKSKGVEIQTGNTAIHPEPQMADYDMDPHDPVNDDLFDSSFLFLTAISAGGPLSRRGAEPLAERRHIRCRLLQFSFPRSHAREQAAGQLHSQQSQEGDAGVRLHEEAHPALRASARTHRSESADREALQGP